MRNLWTVFGWLVMTGLIVVFAWLIVIALTMPEAEGKVQADYVVWNYFSYIAVAAIIYAIGDKWFFKDGPKDPLGIRK